MTPLCNAQYHKVGCQVGSFLKSPAQHCIENQSNPTQGRMLFLLQQKASTFS